MDPYHIWMILLFLLLFLLSAFFSGSEVALVSLSPAKARSLIKKPGGKKVIYLKEHPNSLLITILIGNNLVNIALPVLATVFFTELFGDHILGIMTGVLTLLLLIFGEITPKSLAKKHAEGFGLIAGPIIFWLHRLFFPIIWPLEKLLQKVSSERTESTFSDEELIALAEIGEREGELEEDERERIESILEFGDHRAEDVMTPRTKIDSLPEETTIDDAVRFFLEKTHSRIPIYKGSIDHVVGIITLKNILQLSQERPGDTILKDVEKKEALMIPPTMPLTDLLQEMKRKRRHMAIVSDEHGGTAGLVTLEDLLEEVFGDIEDETDIREREIRKLKNGDWLVVGDVELYKIRELFGIEPQEEEEENEVLARKILEILRRFPKKDEEVEIFPGILAVIEQMKGHKIMLVRLKILV